MKKVISFVALSLFLTGTAVFGQNASGLDLSSTAPQFFSFDIGAGIGYALDSNWVGQVKGVTVVGFKVAVIDSLEVGVDTLSKMGIGGEVKPAFVGLRIGYRFTPNIGAAIGLGQASVLSEPAVYDTDGTVTSGGAGTAFASPGISLGAFYDIFTKRSANGIATALKVRVDYVAETANVAKGALFFSPVFTVGL
ncbi:MAG: hypothetical protein LBL31_00770 [Spirochaetaceae bacterium]|jgi:hypothetical protein|nr:hypothetical protein [Spirochaetaceae bacterium]